jgi:hypothetical protein
MSAFPIRQEQIEDVYIIAAGKSGGQTLYGGTEANDDLALEPTSHATKDTAYVKMCLAGGNVGIGSTSANAKLYSYVTQVVSGSGTNYCIAIQANASKKIAAGVTDSGYLYGMYFSAFRNYTTGDDDNGSLTDLCGIFLQYGHYNRSATATPDTPAMSGLKIRPMHYYGTIGTMADLWLMAQSGSGTPTTAYGIYQVNTKKNSLAGALGVGTTVPDRKVEINDASGNCLRLTYNDADGSAANYSDFLVSSAGKLAIVPSGSAATIQAAINHGVDSGGTDSYAITLAPAPAGYIQGMQVVFKANTANTGAASLNVNSLGAKTIVKAVSTALSNNDILAGMYCLVIYDGTNFVLMNPRAL